MNAKEIVQKQVNDLVVAIAELYSPLMIDEDLDDEFEIIAEAVATERDQLVDNLLTLVEVMIEDNQEELKRAELKRAVRLRKMIPSDIPAPVVAEAAPIAPPAPAEPPVMEAVAPLPREVISANTALELPQNFTEVAHKALAAPRTLLSGSDVMDMADNDDYTHNLGLTLAEEGRRDAGLPIKLARPVIHVGQPKPTVVEPTPAPPKEVSAPETNFTLEEIEEEARGK